MSRERFLRLLDAAEYLAAHIHEALVWIVPCLKGGTPTRTSGSSIYPAVQYMLLTARALGLGTTLTTLYLQFEKKSEAALGLPPGVHSYALLPIGYPMGRFGRVRRVPLTDVVFGVRFTRPDRSQGGDYVCSGLQMALALAAAEPHRGACTRIEASGFAGIWVGDPLGRTLDPLTELAALAAVTATLRDRRLTLPTSTAHNRRGGG